MIAAHFDDSGTHDQSEIVMVAGIFGTEGRLRGLEANWRTEIASPLEGRKSPLKRFHSWDCQNCSGEFEGWNLNERDWLVGRLQKHIINSEVAAYGCAVQRKDWDELVVGNHRHILGTAETFCIRNCFIIPARWVVANTFDYDMSFIFDSRPSPITREAHAGFDAFQKGIERPRYVSIGFGSSEKLPLLQAADMVAYEMYSHAYSAYRTGDARLKREVSRALFEKMPFRTQIATRDSIQKMIDQVWAKEDPKTLSMLAEHFANFNPDAPEYSGLSAS